MTKNMNTMPTTRNSRVSAFTLASPSTNIPAGRQATAGEKVKIFNISDTASDYIRDEEGTTTTSQVYLSLIRDRRDNYLFPTRGYRLKGTVVFAGGPLGFDNDFYKVILEGHKFYPFKWDSAFHLCGLLGYADGYGGQKLPLYERFYVGGLKTLRGF